MENCRRVIESLRGRDFLCTVTLIPKLIPLWCQFQVYPASDLRNSLSFADLPVTPRSTIWCSNQLSYASERESTRKYTNYGGEIQRGLPRLRRDAKSALRGAGLLRGGACSATTRNDGGGQRFLPFAFMKWGSSLKKWSDVRMPPKKLSRLMNSSGA